VKLDIVATGFIVHDNKVLLILHKKLQTWLPPGGHIDPDEMPHDAVVREIQEETGLDVEIQSPVPTVKGTVPVPFSANRHNVGDHDHYSLDYLCKLKSTKISLQLTEIDDAKWFSADDLANDDLRENVRNIGMLALQLANK